MRRKMPRSGAVEVDSSAEPEQVWSLLTDVTRIGEWSHECRSAAWLDGASSAGLGTRFRGSNKAGIARWGRSCLITELEPPRRFSYRTYGSLFKDSTEWTFEIEPVAGGCRVRQSYQVLSLPAPIEWVILQMVPAHLDRSAALRADLARLVELAAETGSAQQR